MDTYSMTCDHDPNGPFLIEAEDMADATRQGQAWCARTHGDPDVPAPAVAFVGYGPPYLTDEEARDRG